MVTVHELGHYIAGKALNFKITEFSVGFGKAIFSRTSKKTGEKFSLRIFPLGGYCAFYGEDDGKENDPESFNSQKPWKRIIVFLAGVTMNFLTAIIFSWILLCTVGYDVPEIVNYSNTYNAGVFCKGDVVTKVGDTKVDFAFGDTFNNLINKEEKKAAAYYTSSSYDANTSSPYSFVMTVSRNGIAIDLDVNVYQKEFTVTKNGKTETVTAYIIGLESDIVAQENGVEKISCIETFKYGFFAGFLRAVPMACGFAWIVLKSLWMLITFKVGIKDLGGTVTTVVTMAEYAKMNMANLLIFIPLISANLAIFNVLPIPALDGAHVLFTTIEWIRGKPINRDIEAKIHFAGLVVLMAFVVIVDILHFIL